METNKSVVEQKCVVDQVSVKAAVGHTCGKTKAAKLPMPWQVPNRFVFSWRRTTWTSFGETVACLLS